MKKLLVFVSCFVLALSLSLTASATPSAEVLGEQFTNPGNGQAGEVLGDSWSNNASTGDENSSTSPKTSDSSLIVYAAGMGAITLEGYAKKKATR